MAPVRNLNTKILLFDIETAPNLAYVWGKYEQDVIDYEHEWYMLSFAYKWLGDKKINAYSLPDFRGYSKDKENDKELTKKLWELMNEADIIMGHNSDQFDIRKTNARFIANGLLPPEPFRTIDTKKVAKRYFNFNSNSLNDLAKYLKLGEKVDTGGFELWRGCMVGDKKSWRKMIEYNKHDIVLLEKIYYVLRPWITNHPNLNILDDKKMSCPNCKSKKIQSRGWQINTVNKRRRYQCMECGRWSIGKIEKTNIELR